MGLCLKSILLMLCVTFLLTPVVGLAKPTTKAKRPPQKPAAAQLRTAVQQNRALQTTQLRVQHQALVSLRSTQDLKKFKASLPKEISIAAQQGKFILLRKSSAFSSLDLARLKKIPSIVHVQKDSLAQAQKNNQTKTPQVCPDCGTTEQNTALSPLPALPETLEPCATFEKCPQNQRSKLWAQERVDADLMQTELTRIGASLSNVSVAVVDTGFDEANLKDAMAEGLTVKKGLDLADAPFNDTAGHGTAVASLIGAKNGIGVAPGAKLTVYRATEQATSTSTPSSYLTLSIEKACAEGAEIINLSWGGLFDETGVMADEELEKEFLKSMLERGCLIVKAAGNAAVRDRNTAHDNPDDAYLRVAASNPAGSLSLFSTPGEIFAPGSGVFALESTLVEKKSDDLSKQEEFNKSCGTGPGKFTSGTSFAAPLTTGIAANILAVLKTAEKFTNLSPPEKIKLLNRILVASQHNASVNGLRAVLMAEAWIKEGPVNNPTTQELEELLNSSQKDHCSQKVENCLATDTCLNFNQCLKKARKQNALCKNFSNEKLNNLLEAQVLSQNLESAVALLRSSSEGKAATAKKLWQAFLNRWSQNSTEESNSLLSKQVQDEIRIKFALDFDMASEVLSTYFQEETNTDELQKALDTLFSSFDLETRLNLKPQAGGNDYFEKFIALVVLAKEKLGPGAVLKLIKAKLQTLKDPGATSGEAERAAVILSRLLTYLLQDSNFSDSSEALQTVDQDLFNALNAQRKTLGTNYAISVYLEPLFTRHQEELVTLIDQGLEKKDFSSIHDSALNYAALSDTLLPIEKKTSLVQELFRQTLNPKQTTFVQSLEFSKNLMQQVQNLVENNPALLAGIQKDLLSSPCILCKSTLLPFTVGNRPLDFEIDSALSNKLVTKDFLFKLPRQTFKQIAQLSEQDLEKNAFDLSVFLKKAAPFLLEDPDFKKEQSAKELHNVVLLFIRDTQKAFQGEEVIDANFMRRIFNLDSLQALLENTDVLKAIDSFSTWKLEAQKILLESKATNNPYPVAFTQMLEKALNPKTGLNGS